MYLLAGHIGVIRTYIATCSLRIHCVVNLVSATCLQRQLKLVPTPQSDPELTWMMNTLGFPMREGQLMPLKYL